MSAISLYFKSKYGDQVKIVGVQPAPNEVIPGIRRIETGMKWYHWVKFDEIIDVRQMEAIEATINVARRGGIIYWVKRRCSGSRLHQNSRRGRRLRTSVSGHGI